MCLQLSGTVDTVDTRDAAVIAPHIWPVESLVTVTLLPPANCHVMSNTAARVTRDTGHVTPVIQSVTAGCNVVIKSLLQKVYGSVASVASLVLL